MILLKDFREAAGLSQKELSVKSGVTQQMISMIETGERKNPSADILYRLSSALYKKMDELYYPEDMKEGEHRDAG